MCMLAGLEFFKPVEMLESGYKIKHFKDQVGG